MTHVVESGHVETLTGGRMVAPGEEISDAEARKNQKLIDRGVLSKRPEKRTHHKKDGAADKQEEDHGA
jgi:hypothetical protein